MHDLLNEPRLTWRGADRSRHEATLPGLLAALSGGRVADFPRTRVHQFHPWAMFLAQVGAIALRRGGLAEPPEDEEAWRGLLRGLDGGAASAWELVVEDLAQPAFFQAPVPEGALEGWARFDHPDLIDYLVTAKNHDLKRATVDPSDAEAWVYALVALQTMQGYPGRGYNGIARMNGGYGNRPRVAVQAGLTASDAFRRDIRVMLGAWGATSDRFGYRDLGLALLWLPAWEGKGSLGVANVCPYFVEICRRVRIVAAAEGLACASTTNDARRFSDQRDVGDVGDPWIPVDTSDAKALTVGPGGLGYERLTELLFPKELAPAEAARPRDDDPEAVWFGAWALPRGQGKTEGVHERLLRLDRPVALRWGAPATRDLLGGRARDRIAVAKKFRSKVLFPALKKLAPQGDPPKDRFDDLVDEHFFGGLFDSVELSDDEARLGWERVLAGLARQELERLTRLAAMPGARKYKVEYEAWAAFWGALHRHFPDVARERGPDVPPPGESHAGP